MGDDEAKQTGCGKRTDREEGNELTIWLGNKTNTSRRSFGCNGADHPIPHPRKSRADFDGYLYAFSPHVPWRVWPQAICTVSLESR